MASPWSSKAIRPFICSSCLRQQVTRQGTRTFTSTTSHRADSSPPKPPTGEDQDAVLGSLGRLGNSIQVTSPSRSRRQNQPQQPNPYAASANPFTSILDSDPSDPTSLITEPMGYNLNADMQRRLPHRLHVYAHKHNTHITLVQPARSAAETMTGKLGGARVSKSEEKRIVDVLISLSTGNIGFRKSARSSYDAAFQLAAFVLTQINERGLWRSITNLEIVLRGFGAGREAVTKAIMGSEGRFARDKISAVVDATRLKQGGPRSKKPRRLG